MPRKFPKSLAMLGLKPGFTNKQFSEVMKFMRSNEIRELAHQEWLDEQSPELDDCFNYRWYLSYVSMKNIDPDGSVIIV